MGGMGSMGRICGMNGRAIRGAFFSEIRQARFNARLNVRIIMLTGSQALQLLTTSRGSPLPKR
jgi:hypothetical protein